MNELNHSAGKGDKNRSDPRKLIDNWPIGAGWTHELPGGQRVAPGRLRKIYRPKPEAHVFSDGLV